MSLKLIPFSQNEFADWICGFHVTILVMASLKTPLLPFFSLEHGTNLLPDDCLHLYSGQPKVGPQGPLSYMF